MSDAKPIPNHWRHDSYTRRGQDGFIGRITPAQLRRMRKKARKNNDTSIDFLVAAFGVKS